MKDRKLTDIQCENIANEIYDNISIDPIFSSGITDSDIYKIMQNLLNNMLFDIETLSEILKENKDWIQTTAHSKSCVL